MIYNYDYIVENFVERKDCATCEFNFGGKCAGRNDLYGKSCSEIIGFSLCDFPCEGYQMDFLIFSELRSKLLKGKKPHKVDMIRSKFHE